MEYFAHLIKYSNHWKSSAHFYFTVQIQATFDNKLLSFKLLLFLTLKRINSFDISLVYILVVNNKQKQ